MKEKLFRRYAWEEGVKELQAFLGEDPYCMKILWEQLHFVCTYSIVSRFFRKINFSRLVAGS